MARTEALKTKVAKPASVAAAPDVPSREERLVAWLKANQKLLAIAGGVVAGIVLITWFLSVSSARKEAFARAQLEQAWAAQDGGNLPQAASELQRVATTYAGTRAAHEAVLSLNQTRLLLGQAQLAVDDVRRYLDRNPPAWAQTRAYVLLGTGLENLSRPAEAAAAYDAAVERADMDFEKADALVSAARAWEAAGNRDQAVARLRRVVEEYKETGAHGLAELRLGELTGGPTKTP